MEAEWFRQSVNGLMPDYVDGKNKFKGSQREFSGMTLSPLNTATEALMPFTWRLRFEPKTGQTQLQYGSNDDAPAVLAWYPTARRGLVWNLSGDQTRLTVRRDGTNLATLDMPPLGVRLVEGLGPI